MHKNKPNALIRETSPYLLQHAHNPVAWLPWSQDVLDNAKKKNKLLIISIGYSTCHWCHVMEHESFEDAAVAELMNSHYLSVKVDREERPDVDHFYMNAVQLMTGSGGWPLNVVTLPDGRPVWGGTYFTKEQWTGALTQIQQLFTTQPKVLYDYADKLEKGIRALDIVAVNKDVTAIEKFDIKSSINQWAATFDMEKGGIKGAPKFMMPSHLSFLLQEAELSNHTRAKQYVTNTLTQMAYGGIFDQANGGFSRYAVDERWHVPHFEKMLYDNARLVSLYCDAYLVTKNPLYKEVVYKTLRFIKNELTSPEGLFYTALDADSLDTYGVLKEGAYYTFTEKELKETLGEDFQLFATYYNVNEYGKWEGGYILIRTLSDDEIQQQFSIDSTTLHQKKKRWQAQLQHLRKEKTRPRLDNKCLTSWNAMMIKAYVDAYRVFQEKDFLDTAIECAGFIKTHQLQKDGLLYRNYTDNTASIIGYLDDYAFLTEAFIALYEVTFDESWLRLSKTLTEYTIHHFYDTATGMFFYTSDKGEQLRSRSIEYRDNVIPSSNAVHAHNLLRLGRLFINPQYTTMARQMTQNVIPEIHTAPIAYTHWLKLISYFQNGFYEVAVVGHKAHQMANELQQHYIPNKVLCGTTTHKSSLEILQNRFAETKTVIYVCRNNTCQLPVTETENALKLIHD